MPQQRDTDSIFASPESGDALFQESPKLPPMGDIPPPSRPAQAWPNLQMDAGAAPPPVPPAETELPTVAYEGENPLSEAAAPVQDPPVEDATVQMDAGWSAPESSEPPRHQEATLEMSEPPATPRRVAARGGTSLFVIGVLIFLFPYAALTTAAAIYLYYLMKNAPNPLEMLQDAPSEYPGATRKGPSSRVYQRVDPDTKLPPHLHVALGGAIQVGDLEVKPLKVQRKPVVFKYERSDRQPTASTNDALVLTLALKNVSQDVTFMPTDPAFVKKWRRGEDVPMNRPYNLLEVGKERFYGGPCKWSPHATAITARRDRDPQEYLEGADFKTLKPGESMETLVATDPYDPAVLKTVDGHSGPLVWRVHVRRGLVKTKNGDVSATAVIGVAIKAQEVPRP
jgi:hypothetical protein